MFAIRRADIMYSIVPTLLIENIVLMRSLTFKLHVKFMVSSILAPFDIQVQLGFPTSALCTFTESCLFKHVFSVPRNEELIPCFAINSSSKRIKGL